MRTSTRLTPMRGSTPPASSSVTLMRRARGLVHHGHELGAVGAGQGEHAARHRSSHSATAASSSGTLSKNAPRLAWACTAGNVERPLLSTVARSPRRSSASAGRGCDEPGEERGRQPLPVDHDRLAPRELREQVVAALAARAAAHHPAGDLVAQVLAQRRLGIEAGVDQQHARGRLVGGDGKRGGRRVAEREQMRAGGREAALELGQAEPEVVAEGLERDVLRLARALPRSARVDQQRAVAAGGERAHQLHERAARADRLAGERRHDEQREGGVVWPVGVREHGRERIPGVGGGRHHRQAMTASRVRQARIASARPDRRSEPPSHLGMGGRPASRAGARGRGISQNERVRLASGRASSGTRPAARRAVQTAARAPGTALIL